MFVCWIKVSDAFNLYSHLPTASKGGVWIQGAAPGAVRWGLMEPRGRELNLMTRMLVP